MIGAPQQAWTLQRGAVHCPGQHGCAGGGPPPAALLQYCLPVSFTDGAFFLLMGAFMLVWPLARARHQVRWVTITAFSLVFYGWWDWRFLFLLLGTGGLDFGAALLIERRPAWRRSLLWVSIVSNIGVLAGFKYLGFGLDSLALLLDIPPQARSWAHEIILPVGISFYTFQSLSYTIDVYRGNIRAVHNPWHFLAYLSMFPQLVAGPIVRATDLIPQLATPGHYNAANRLWGLRVAAWGYLKKVVVADNVAPIVNDAFAATPELGLGWWAVAALFAIQIYCDFSGYSDIACGIARWMGYQFPQNFRQPYAAAGPREFWSRWHITLSTWFRDYVYIPLGGSRMGAARTTLNQAFTMIVSGLWHGANWTFVCWGAFHGALLIIERVVRGDRPEPLRGAPRIVAIVLTLAAVLIGWVVFRAESMGQANVVVKQMLAFRTAPLPWIALPSVWLAVGVMSLGAVHAWVVGKRSTLHVGLWPVWAQSTAIVVALWAGVFLRGPGSDFIYFQF